MNASARRIGVIEDEWAVAHHLEAILQGAGHEVAFVARTGADALAATAERRPDLLLVDITLPGEMDGIAVAREIGIRYGSPVVFVTAHADDLTLTRAREVNALGYVVKPFHERQVRSTVSTALGRLDGERVLFASLGRIRAALADLDAAREPHDARSGAAELGRLSDRERSVVQALLASSSVVETAGALQISVHTVRNHLKAAYRKLGVHSQMELFRKLNGPIDG